MNGLHIHKYSGNSDLITVDNGMGVAETIRIAPAPVADYHLVALIDATGRKLLTLDVENGAVVLKYDEKDLPEIQAIADRNRPKGVK